MKTIGLLLIVAVVALGVDVCGVGIAKAQTSGRAMGTAPGAGASSEDLWQRAVALIDRNDYRDAIPLLQQAAKMGHAKAQATLGIAYQDGNGVRADDRAAAYWFGLAAAQGHRASEYALGGMYEEGEGGLPRDPRKAGQLYLASARQGFDKAELIVGVNYLTGDDGLPNDRQQAIEWLRKAAAQDSPFARDLLIVLSDRSAPASFANIAALGAYLTRLSNEEMARNAARSGGYRQDTNVVARINAAREMTAWNASRGAGNGGCIGPC
jgi:TPR repeat protein